MVDSGKHKIWVTSIPDCWDTNYCHICTKKKAYLKFHPCKHTVVCLSCFHKRRFTFNHCSLCGEKVLYTQNVKKPKECFWNKCYVCLKKPAHLEFSPCKHRMVCISCYRNGLFKFIRCPACGEKVNTAENQSEPRELFSNEKYEFVC